MGRSTTPKYVAIAYSRTPKGQLRQEELDWKGRATQAKVDDLRDTYNKSFQPGGANFFLSKSLGYVPHYFKVCVVTNDRARNVVVESTAPPFEVV